ncbi:Hypothetical predicted protein [Mytilus galloprovincialis]|uniref:C-type lectin domain-containing protein n=1 Tax=Mytilus galloprovincialis TaxID=29158 RepID=A0A8B6CUX6_MYTGA|nr:Hypothetical predicted protein [Mytilus galloprovincialis]
MGFLIISLLIGVGGFAIVLARELRIPISGTINIDASILDEYIEQKIDEEFGGISGMNGIGDCEPGWLEYKERCFFISTNKKSWLDAQDYCWNFDGYLAEIRDNQTDKYVKSLLEKDEDNNQRIFFIGASDLEGDNRWIWANSRKPVTSTYREHFNSSGGHCAAVMEEGQSTFRLHNLHCDRKLRFICEVDKIY